MGDKLTNNDISTRYRDEEFWLMQGDFIAAFAYWVVAQSPYLAPDITEALGVWGKYVSNVFGGLNLPVKFTYHDLSVQVTEDVFESMPEILELNRPKVSSGVGYMSRHSVPHPDYDFIDLSALARNVFYMILRECITQR